MDSDCNGRATRMVHSQPRHEQSMIVTRRAALGMLTAVATVFEQHAQAVANDQGMLTVADLILELKKHPSNSLVETSVRILSAHAQTRTRGFLKTVSFDGSRGVVIINGEKVVIEKEEEEPEVTPGIPT